LTLRPRGKQGRRDDRVLGGHTVAIKWGQREDVVPHCDAVDVVRTIAAAAGSAVEIAQGQRAALHPGRTATVTAGGREIGYAGELLPDVAADADLTGRVYVVELDLDQLLASAGDAVVATSLSAHTPATQDVSLVVPVEVPAADVRAALVDGCGTLLESLRLVDDYRGQGIADGTKSLTFALLFRGADRTLTAADATAAKLQGVELAAERFGAKLRD